MLGFDLSEKTISRWMKRDPKDPEPAQRWLAFLRNYREAIVAMDFFIVSIALPEPGNFSPVLNRYTLEHF